MAHQSYHPHSPVTILDGQPAIPVQPTALQRAGYVLLWVVAVALPAAWIGLRMLFGLGGWIFFMFLMFGTFFILFTQVVLGAVATARSGGFARRAIGSRAARTSFAYYACWLALAVTIGDFGDTGPAARSPVEELVGTDVAGALIVVLLIAGLVLLVLTLVFIVTGDREARELAIAAHRSMMPGPGQPPAPPGGGAPPFPHPGG